MESAPGHRFHLEHIAPGSPRRPGVEQFIARAFGERHGAEVRSFLPELLGLCDKGNELCAAAGYRPAATWRLFLEQYLDQPVEEALASQLGSPVSRDGIVEIGNLAGGTCRAARQLVALLPRYLLERGHTWVVFTATDLVRRILGGAGAHLVELAPADPARLGAGAEAWGAYYRMDPRVMAGFIPEGLTLRPRRHHRPAA